MTVKRGSSELKAGDKVLMGRPGVTLPIDWFIGAVIWTDGSDVLVEQYGLGGARGHKRLCEMAEIRAFSRAGGWQQLQGFRAEAESVAAEQSDHVRDCELALGRARQDVWTKLEEIGADVRRFVDDPPQRSP